MPIMTKHPLSASLDGMPIFVTTTSSSNAAEIHTVQATATNVLELVTLWASANATSGAQLTPAIQYDSGATVEVFALNVQASVAVDFPGKHGTPIIHAMPRTGTTAIIEAHKNNGTLDFYVWGHVDRIATG